MSLWLYKCNNLAKEDGPFGDWDWFFEQAGRSKTGTAAWGGPRVTNQASGRKLVKGVQPGQQFLCWQRWGTKPDYALPKGVDAAAVGVVEFVKPRRSPDPGAQWLLKPVKRFARPVPLLEYRSSSDVIEGIFRNPRQMGTFVALDREEERLVRQLCGLPRGDIKSWKEAARNASDGRGSKGAGFGDEVNNRAVEKAAVRFVTRTLAADGWKVVSREQAKVGYDLRAKRGKVERHIEVKGVKGRHPDFMITEGEVSCASDDPKWEIWIVTSALKRSRKATVLPGADLVQRYSLTPISYRASTRVRHSR